MKTIDLLAREDKGKIIVDDIFLLLANFGKIRILYESKKEKDNYSVKDKLIRYVQNHFYNNKPNSLKINKSRYEFKKRLNDSEIVFV